MFDRLIKSKSDEELNEILQNIEIYEHEFIIESFKESEVRKLSTFDINHYVKYLSNKKTSEIEDILEKLDITKNKKLFTKTDELVKRIKSNFEKQPAKIKRLIYAGFGARFGANLIDTLIFIPIIIFSLWLISTSIVVAIISQVLMMFLFSAYSVYFHGKCGATIGKQIVSIKVVKLDHTKIGWKEAILRSSVDLAFSFFIALGRIIAILSIPATILFRTGLFEIMNVIDANTFDIFNFVDSLMNIWFWSEVVVLLFNKKKRAIHDFIAGTVVIHY